MEHFPLAIASVSVCAILMQQSASFCVSLTHSVADGLRRSVSVWPVLSQTVCVSLTRSDIVQLL